MVSRLSVRLGVLSLFCGAMSLASPDVRAEGGVYDLVRRADRVLRSKTSAALFRMKIKTRSYERTLDIVFWEDDHGKVERTLIKILGPALWRGYGTLKVGSQLKLYNPRDNHVTVVGQSMLGDAWMGSHFSNDDLVKETRLATHYRAKIVKTWKGKAKGGAVTFHRISLWPKPTAPVAWGRIDYVLWVRGALVMPTEARYFRKAHDRKARRMMHFGEVKKLGGRLVPSTMTVTVASKPGEFTRIRYRKLKFDVRLPKNKFTEQALRR
ncbi:MAG: outer membrane lipoprotein-sorting protein [Deltaproteobacteria bacterium]|nr:outer membrane lipoprotein-sorting protein [Deltaproteobacteria bacterium]